MSVALYHLSHHPTTFDFAAWAIIAKTHGCDHVRFVSDGPIQTTKYPDYIAWRRFGNILVPLCQLAGLSFSVGPLMRGRQFPYLYGHVEQTYIEQGHIAKLAAPEERLLKPGYVTVTMRESFRNTFRNSNRPAWDRFVTTLRERGRKVVVIEECESAPMILEQRMAIYAGADMNLGASGGPMTLCHFSDAPYLTLNMAPKRPEGERGYDPEQLMASSGFPFGSQFSFRNERQLLVWKPDTFENIISSFDEMDEQKRAAA